jgi:tetratricopeptide (TPR) repeat protein
MRGVRSGVGMLLLLPLWASAAPTYTQADVAQLPIFCQAKIGALQNDLNEVKRWEQVFGVNNWLHMHHYCSGLAWFNKARVAFGADKPNRAFYLGESINNYMYVIRAWPQEFQLQPEANLGVGRAWQMSGQDRKAISFYMKAISLRPDFVQAYAALADLWMNLGDKVQAREVLEQGLKNTSNAEPLVRQMAQLEAGGSGSRPASAGATLPGRTTTGTGSAKKP